MEKCSSDKKNRETRIALENRARREQVSTQQISEVSRCCLQRARSSFPSSVEIGILVRSRARGGALVRVARHTRASRRVRADVDRLGVARAVAEGPRRKTTPCPRPEAATVCLSGFLNQRASHRSREAPELGPRTRRHERCRPSRDRGARREVRLRTRVRLERRRRRRVPRSRLRQAVRRAPRGGSSAEGRRTTCSTTSTRSSSTRR